MKHRVVDKQQSILVRNSYVIKNKNNKVLFIGKKGKCNDYMEYYNKDTYIIQKL